MSGGMDANTDGRKDWEFGNKAAPKLNAPRRGEAEAVYPPRLNSAALAVAVTLADIVKPIEMLRAVNSEEEQ